MSYENNTGNFEKPRPSSTISYILKVFSIGGDNLCDKKLKNTKSLFWPYISTLKKKTDGKYLTTQYNNINDSRYTYSRRKTWKYNIWWSPGQFYTHIMYCRSQSELRYIQEISKTWIFSVISHDYFYNFLYLSN